MVANSIVSNLFQIYCVHAEKARENLYEDETGPNKVLIGGGTGFIGTELCKAHPHPQPTRLRFAGHGRAARPRPPRSAPSRLSSLIGDDDGLSPSLPPSPSRPSASGA